MRHREISKRYALALSNLVSSSELSTVEEQFFSFCESLKESVSIKEFFFSRTISSTNKKEVLKKHLKDINSVFLKFMMLL